MMDILNSAATLLLIAGVCLALRTQNRTIGRHNADLSWNFTAIIGLRSKCRALESRIDALEDRSRLVEDDQK